MYNPFELLRVRTIDNKIVFSGRGPAPKEHIINELLQMNNDKKKELKKFLLNNTNDLKEKPGYQFDMSGVDENDYDSFTMFLSKNLEFITAIVNYIN